VTEAAKGVGRNEKLMKEREEYIPRGVKAITPIFIQKAAGHKFTDVEGKEYLDLTGGIGVLSTGHLPSSVITATKQQMDKYLHTCFMLLNYEPYVELAKELRRITPGHLEKSAFFNSGAEAVENAVKIARAYKKRPGVISFHNSFHGRTFLTLAMTGKYAPYKVDYGPLVPNVHQVPFAYCYRCPLNLKYPDCSTACLRAFDDLFHCVAPASEMACVALEPVQGEGGFVVPPNEWVKGGKEICEKDGIVFVSDEIQAGMGRTGKWFAIEHFGIQPDIITTSKALGAGLPISGVTGRGEVMDAPSPGALGGTFGGNPLSCVAALENIKLIEKALPNVPKLEKAMRKRFEEMRERHKLIGDVRGLGAMQAIELVKDRKTKEPAKDQTNEVIRRARDNGLFLLSAGWHSNVIRLLPPLNMPVEGLEEAMDILEKSLSEAERR